MSTALRSTPLCDQGTESNSGLADLTSRLVDLGAVFEVAQAIHFRPTTKALARVRRWIRDGVLIPAASSGQGSASGFSYQNLIEAGVLAGLSSFGLSGADASVIMADLIEHGEVDRGAARISVDMEMIRAVVMHRLAQEQEGDDHA